jgi:hypothetical protein
MRRVVTEHQEEMAMSRRFVAAASAIVTAASLSVLGQGVASSLPAAGTAAAPATPELSNTTRLADRREVAAGSRAYSIGFEDGRFYANGWHTTGEMGGVWTFKSFLVIVLGGAGNYPGALLGGLLLGLVEQLASLFLTTQLSEVVAYVLLVVVLLIRPAGLLGGRQT